MTARLCLKARPTDAQLRDRLRAVDGVWPDGVELYLAAADLGSDEVLSDIAERLSAAPVPEGFAWLIEGPVDSLDGADFDVTRDSPADALVVERLAWLSERIGARAVNIHAIAPHPDLTRLTLETRQRLLERAVPFLGRFVALMQEAGSVPTVENMPPVLRMRRSDFSFTPIGMASADLCWLAEHVPGLRILPDTSHAGLYLFARFAQADPTYAWSGPLKTYLEELPPDPNDVVAYMERLQPWVENAQISDASGLLGEGLPYGAGDLDMDAAIRWLGDNAQHIVTETLESDNADAVHMRAALGRMRAVLAP